MKKQIIISLLIGLVLLSGCMNAEKCVDICLKQDMVVDSYKDGKCICFEKDIPLQTEDVVFYNSSNLGISNYTPEIKYQIFCSDVPVLLDYGNYTTEITLKDICKILGRETWRIDNMEEDDPDVIFLEGGQVGFGDPRTPEEIEEDKKSDSRLVKEYIDNENVTWKYIGIFYDGHQPITVWERQDTKEMVEMFGYYGPQGRLIIRGTP